MDSAYFKWFSPQLDQDMELKVYGWSGKPVLVFPTQNGRFYDYEDYGMLAACSHFIETGLTQFFCIDSIDNQTWANRSIHPVDRAHRHEQYDRYVTQEVVPFIYQHSDQVMKLLVTGCSMGGYHSANFFFRHPDIFDALISLSGILRLNLFIGDYMDENVYFNTPLAYLPNLIDPWYIDQYRQSQIVVCAGQGPWEDIMVEDARTLQKVLADKDIPCWIDLWGHDVNHDWPWWRKMMPYFLGKIFHQSV